MKFYLSLEKELVLGPEYRLQRDDSWRKVKPLEPLNGNDYSSRNLSEVAGKIKRDEKIILAGKEYISHPTGPVPLFGDHVNPVPRVVREESVKVPSYEQLLETLICGDDKQNNNLVLLLNADFALYSLEDAGRSDSGVAVYYRTFLEGENEVGFAVRELDEYVMRTYYGMLQEWLTHLRMGKLNIFCDNEDIGSLKEIISEIKELSAVN